MSLQKAQDLLKLAHIAASRYHCTTVKEIATKFSVNERTAQRMVFALKELYPSLKHTTDSERRRRWTLRETNRLGMQGIFEYELAALEMAIRRAEREGAPSEAASLQAVRDRLVAKLPTTEARRTEANAEPQRKTMKHVPTSRSGANAAKRLSPSAPCEDYPPADVPGPDRTFAPWLSAAARL